MRINSLLLPKNQILRLNHTGTGKIVTLHSNTRWCSDACFNDEKVFVAFPLDCKDREAISYVASKKILINHVSTQNGGYDQKPLEILINKQSCGSMAGKQSEN
jgi:hypothetical protein